MSTVRLKHDHDGKPKGAVISVPFGTGRDLVTRGIAEYPAAPLPAPRAAAEPAAAQALVPKPEYDALAKRAAERDAELAARLAELAGHVRDLAAEIALLKEQFEGVLAAARDQPPQAEGAAPPAGAAAKPKK